MPGIELANLDLLVPHQANQRIIDTIAKRSGRPALSVIETYGNTSSSSIPLAMMHVANRTLRAAQPRPRRLRRWHDVRRGYCAHDKIAITARANRRLLRTAVLCGRRILNA